MASSHTRNLDDYRSQRTHTSNMNFMSGQSISKSLSQVAHDDDVIPQRNVNSRVKNWVNENFRPENCEPVVQSPLCENTRHTEILYEAIKALSARQAKDLPQFTGSIKEWPIFYNEFIRTTEEFHVSKTENLRRLNLALSGKAREAVLPLLTSSENIDTIIHVLKRNFGEPEWVIAYLIEDLKKIPIIASEDFEAYRNFYNKVTGTVKSIEQLNGIQYLNNPELLSCLSHKLPSFSKALWLITRRI